MSLTECINSNYFFDFLSVSFPFCTSIRHCMWAVQVYTTGLRSSEGEPGHVVCLPGAGSDEAQVLELLHHPGELGLLYLEGGVSKYRCTELIVSQHYSKSGQVYRTGYISTVQ